jgi:hypothetical protein
MEDTKEELLEKTLELSEENNKMLKNLLRRARFATWVGIVRWTIIILVALGGYYFLQQYFQKVLELYGKVSDSATMFDSSQQTWKEAYEKFKAAFE